MKRYLAALCLLVSISGQAQQKVIRIVDVSDGNVSALLSEIEAANELAETHQTTIRLFGDFQFGPGDVMPDIVATVSLRGPARLIGGGSGDSSHLGDKEGPSVLFNVRAAGEFRLDNLEVRDFSLNHEGEGLIVNRGSLHLQEVQFQHVTVGHWCVRFCTPVMPMLANLPGGNLKMYRVSMVRSGIVAGERYQDALTGLILNQGEALITNSQVYLDSSSWSTSIFNSGDLQIHSSSFLFRSAGRGQVPPLFASDDPERVKILNSVVSGFRGDSCQHVRSIGYNLNDAADCGWSSSNDLAGIPAGLIWRRVHAVWMYARDQILKYAIVPMAASPAVDSANDDWCVSGSLLANGRIRGEGCDRGAVETVKTTLGEGGINGLYFNPDADGHYLQIMQTEFLTLVIWNTFDLDGNHVWVYGTGQLVNGKSVIAETYINRDAMVLPDMPVPDAATDYWGTLEVEMTSCGSGNVAFESVDPDFGNGQFPIERLASVKQLGCVD